VDQIEEKYKTYKCATQRKMIRLRRTEVGYIILTSLWRLLQPTQQQFELR
jgi:hypothetical protein